MAKIISLDRLCGGALLERVTLAMGQIARNIMDPNTNPEKARTLTIKLTFKPDKGRRGIKTSISTNITLAPPESDETMLLIGQDLRTGRIQMSEYGDNSQGISVAGENLPVKAETIQPEPVQAYDQSTGEIYETAHQGPIDLRKTAM